MKRDEMPVGFSMALAQNPDYMQKFALLDEDEKKEIINGTNILVFLVSSVCCILI